MTALDRALTIDDLKTLARRRVPQACSSTMPNSGAWTEGTYRANEGDFKKITFRQRVAVDSRTARSRPPCWGSRSAMPVAIAPAARGMQTANGEIKAARAAEKFGIPFTLSTMASARSRTWPRTPRKPFWFQLYVMKDRAFIERLIDRAKAAKCSALVLTMDLQILGQRHKDIRNGLLGAAEAHAEVRRRDGDASRAGRWACSAPSGAPSAISPATSQDADESALADRAGPRAVRPDAELERHRAGSRSASAGR